MATPNTIRPASRGGRGGGGSWRGGGGMGGGPSLVSRVGERRGYVDFTDDTYLGRSFTSFEQRGAGAGRQEYAAARRKLMDKWEKVIKEIPSDVKTVEFTIDPEKVVCFSGRGDWLSNFFKAPMNIDGHDYPTVEHYYQACKLYMLGGPRFSNQIRRIPDAGSVKVTTKRLLQGSGVSEQQVQEWKMLQGPHILQHAMINKFVQHAELRKKLLDTADSLLVHSYDKDRIFAVGAVREDFDKWAKENEGKVVKVPQQLSEETLPYYPMFKNGKNLLGLIIMRVRDQIKNFQDDLDEKGEPSDPVLAAAMAALKLKPNEPVASAVADTSATNGTTTTETVKKSSTKKTSKGDKKKKGDKDADVDDGKSSDAATAE